MHLRISKEEILLRHARVRQTLEEAGFDALILQGSCAIDQRGWMRYFIDYYVPVFSEFLVLPLDGPIAFFARNGANGKAVEESGLVDRVQLIPSAEADSKPGKCVGEYLRSIGAKRPVICGETDRAF